jgi:hypothetical protein
MVELYVSRGEAGAVERFARSAGLAADELSREGSPVRYLRSIFVPEDETCFYLYEAASAQVVLEAAQRAGLPFDRITEAVTSPSEGKN